MMRTLWALTGPWLVASCVGSSMGSRSVRLASPASESRTRTENVPSEEAPMTPSNASLSRTTWASMPADRSRVAAASASISCLPVRICAGLTLSCAQECTRDGADASGNRWHEAISRLELVRFERAHSQANLEQQPVENLPLLEVQLG